MDIKLYRSVVIQPIEKNKIPKNISIIKAKKNKISKLENMKI